MLVSHQSYNNNNLTLQHSAEALLSTWVSPSTVWAVLEAWRGRWKQQAGLVHPRPPCMASSQIGPPRCTVGYADIWLTDEVGSPTPTTAPASSRSIALAISRRKRVADGLRVTVSSKGNSRPTPASSLCPTSTASATRSLPGRRAPPAEFMPSSSHKDPLVVLSAPLKIIAALLWSQSYEGNRGWPSPYFNL